MSAERDPAARRRLNFLAAVALAALVVPAAVLLGASGESSEAPAPDAPAAARNAPAGPFDGIPQRGVTLGRPDAPVTLVEFVDFQCPFCRDFSQAVLPDLVQSYVRDGRVKLELRVLRYLGSDSIEAAQFAGGVTAQNRLWQFSQRFFAAQGAQDSGFVTPAFLREVASEVPGLDADRAFTRSTSAAALGFTRRAEAQARRLGVSVAPAIFVGRSESDLKRVTLEALTLGEVSEPIDALLDDQAPERPAPKRRLPKRRR